MLTDRKIDMKEKWLSLPLSRKFTIVILIFVMLPVSLIGLWMLSIQRRNVIHESISYMQHTMERNQDTVNNNINTVNMSAQFFLNDEALQNILEMAMEGREPDTDDLLNFYETDVASLERLVNSNTVLYSVRVYAETDDIQEMMPVLFNHSRMEQQSWAADGIDKGWYYNYEDQLFTGRIGTQGTYLAAYLLPIRTYGSQKIGTIETMIEMSNMFPSLYEEVENEWSCFLTDNDQIFTGSLQSTAMEELIHAQIEEKTDPASSDEIRVYVQQFNRRSYTIAQVYQPELGGTLFTVQDITDKVNQINHLGIIYIGALLALSVLLAYIIGLTVRRILRKFYEILIFISRVQEGDLSSRIENCGVDEMGILGRQINKMLDRIGQLMQDNLDREILIKNSEIRALQNQINTHFIYNVLESIKMMAEIDEEYAISDAITSLGKLLRYSMKWSGGNVFVYEELDYIENYVALMNLRYDYEIHLAVNIPDFLRSQRIPKMSLQPIVENAILHGIEDLAEETTIYIKGYVSGQDCLIEISDQGKGMTPEEVKALELRIAGKLETDSSSGHGIGLKNVEDRIHIAFGEAYGLSFASALGCYTKVTVKIPYAQS